jgi:2-polyprenyl-3-methyl-5-hydroxy-6-metoxy-1,4-benzoquinol methylase
MSQTPNVTVPAPTDPIPCAVCPGGRVRRAFDAVRGSAFALGKCDVCGWERLIPQPTWDEIRAIYKADYYAAWGMAEGETREVADMKRATFGLRLDEVAEHAEGGKLLDVGTASGFLLEVARDRGYQPYGVELSQYAGELARAKFGADRIHIGTLETAPFPPGSFDAVTMCDLIEHVMDPVATLATAARLLRPGGIVLVMTPDTGSLTRRLMGAKWTHYKLEHLSYFDRASMAACAKSAGLEVASVRRCRKVLRLRYLRTQFRTYPHWLFTPAVNLLGGAMPFLLDRDLKMTIGELVAILRKPT